MSIHDTPDGKPRGTRLSRRMFLRAVAGAGAAITGGGILAACGGTAPQAAEPTTAAADNAAPTSAPAVTAAQGSSAATGAEPVTLDVWVQEASANAMAEGIKAFEAKNPTIKINIIPTPIPETTTKLLAAIAAGSGAPDLAFIDYGNMVNFTSRGGQGLTDLSTLMAIDGQKSDWVGWSLDLATAEGKVFGLPVDLGVAAIFYRRDAFDAIGLPSDETSVQKALATWDAYLATGETFAKSGTHWLINNASSAFEVLRQQGTQGYFDDQGNPIVNSKGFVDAAKYAQRLRQAKVDARLTGDEETAALQNGTIATYSIAAWYDIIIKAVAPDTGGKWGVVPLTGGTSMNTGGSYFVIPQQSKNQEAAWTFINYILGTEEGLNAYLSKIKFLPAWQPIYKTDVFTRKDPFYGDQAWLQIFVDGVNKVPKIVTTVNDPIAAESVGQALGRILDENADPQAELDKANQEIADRIKAS